MASTWQAKNISRGCNRLCEKVWSIVPMYHPQSTVVNGRHWAHFKNETQTAITCTALSVYSKCGSCPVLAEIPPDSGSWHRAMGERISSWFMRLNWPIRDI